MLQAVHTELRDERAAHAIAATATVGTDQHRCLNPPPTTASPALRPAEQERGERAAPGRAPVRILKNQPKSTRNHEFQKLELELLVRFFQDFDVVQKNGRRAEIMIFGFGTNIFELFCKGNP